MRIDSESTAVDVAHHNSSPSRRPLTVRIEEQAGRAIELIHLVCDHRDGNDLESIFLKAEDLADGGHINSEPAGRLTVHIPADRVSLRSGAWTIKAVVRDATGRVASTWVDWHVPSGNVTTVVARARRDY